jgi:hypothetical protein
MSRVASLSFRLIHYVTLVMFCHAPISRRGLVRGNKATAHRPVRGRKAASEPSATQTPGILNGGLDPGQVQPATWKGHPGLPTRSSGRPIAISTACAPLLISIYNTTAAITIAGVELLHRIHKGQFNFVLCASKR